MAGAGLQTDTQAGWTDKEEKEVKEEAVVVRKEEEDEVGVVKEGYNGKRAAEIGAIKENTHCRVT